MTCRSMYKIFFPSPRVVTRWMFQILSKSVCGIKLSPVGSNYRVQVVGVGLKKASESSKILVSLDNSIPFDSNHLIP